MASLARAWAGRAVTHGLLGTAATISLLSIAVKAGTAIRELLIAFFFGTGDALDAYLIAYAVPYFLITIIAGSLPVVVVPAYMRLRVRSGQPVASQLMVSTVVLTVVGLTPVVLALIVGTGLYLPLLGSGFSTSKLDLTASLVVILAPTLLTSTLIGLIAALLNAHNRFVLPALSPLITTLTGVCALLAFGTIRALALGTLAGNLVELSALALVLRSIGVPFHSGRFQVSPELRPVLLLLAPTLVGSVLMASTVLVDQAMTSPLGPGSVSALNYANRVVTFPLGLTAAALGTVALPYFSEMVSREAWQEIRASMGRYVRLIFLVTCPIAIGLAVLATPLTTVLFARGAFGSDDVPVVASTIAALALEIPFYSGVILIMRVALALRLNARLAVISALCVGINVALNAWFSTFLGVAGIALSTSVVYMCSFMLLWAVVSRRLRSVSAG